MTVIVRLRHVATVLEAAPVYMWMDKRMCGGSHTAQGDGDEMTAARTSLWTPPRQNVQAKRPAESLGRVAAAPGGRGGKHTAAFTLLMCVVGGLLKGLVSSQKCQDTHTRCIIIFLMANFGSFWVESDT